MMMIIIILIIIVIVFIVISRIHTVKANSDGKKKKILQVFCGYLVVWKPQDNHKINRAYFAVRAISWCGNQKITTSFACSNGANHKITTRYL